MKNRFTNLEKLGPIVLRFGMALVFLWFGFSQIFNPDQWVSFLPGFLEVFPISASNFVLANGSFEVIGGVFLILGVYTRLAALLLALHLFGIAFIIGWNALGVRDFGLAVATLVIFLQGAGGLSFDSKKNQETLGS